MVARGVILTTFAFICFAISKHDCLHDSLPSISNQNHNTPDVKEQFSNSQITLSQITVKLEKTVSVLVRLDFAVSKIGFCWQLSPILL